MLFGELGETLDALANVSKDSVSEKYVLEDCDEKMLEIMSNYEYDYKKIAKEILRGKIDFPKSYIEGKYNEIFLELRSVFASNSSYYTTYNGKIKYEKGILMFGEYKINDINKISKIFDILVECLTEHGEYLKRYLQKKAELDEKLGFLDDEDTNIDENKTDDLF